MIFSLPFHIPRFFRPTMLEVFAISNTELGDIFALYGLIAVLAYFPGGAIADRFSARALMSVSLLATAIGGFYLATIPGLRGLYTVFAVWGLTSILLFWAALIKATRDWAGQNSQGIAFGILDGGRGFVASIFASLAVLLLSQQLASGGNTKAAMQAVILFYSFLTLSAGLIIWFSLGSQHVGIDESRNREMHWYQIFSQPRAWLQASIVICAYCGFKSLDNYGIYAVQVLGMDQVEAAKLNTYASYSRPIAAICAGLIADRWRSSSLITLLFILAALSFFSLSQITFFESQAFMLANILLTFVAVYALRGIYFSLVEEAKIDKRMTGSAVGLISVLGFTPDVFFAPITGRILDAKPWSGRF